jgi:hypothetical protein
MGFSKPQELKTTSGPASTLNSVREISSKSIQMILEFLWKGNTDKLP